MKIIQATQFPTHVEVLVDWNLLLVEAKYKDGILIDSSFKTGSESEVMLDKYIQSKLSGKI